MSSLDRITATFDSIRESHAGNRLSHAYIIIAPPRGEGHTFATSILQLLFCTGDEKPCGVCSGCRRVAGGHHSDVVRIEPQGRGRQIRAVQMREDIITPLSKSSYEGGWKAGVIVEAECLNEASANIFLKTLEEPPPRTLLLLLTDQPDRLLPTIRSRCQIIDLSSGQRLPSGPWVEPLLDILRTTDLGSSIGGALLASRVTGLFKDIQKETEKEVKGDSKDEDLDRAVLDARVRAEVIAIRKGMMTLMQLWYRDIAVRVAGGDDDVLHFPREVETLDRLAAGLDLARAVALTSEIDRLEGLMAGNLPESIVMAEFGVRASGQALQSA